MIRLLSFVLILSFIGCKDTEYAYVDPSPVPIVSTSSFSAVDDLVVEQGPVDVLWVVDNSGSMDDTNDQIIKNTKLFMDEFTSNNMIDWKMGLIATDSNMDPFLGFESSFDSLSPSPVDTFQDAIQELTDSNSWGDEVTMAPILRKLGDFPNFLRPDAMLAIIMVTDEPEQTETITKEDFLKKVTSIKGDRRLVKFYGIMEAQDLNCNGAFGGFNYYNSKFEYLINQTNGSFFPGCDPNFGLELAKISNDIVSNLFNSKYYLKDRPKTETIKVSFKGKAVNSVNSEGKRRWYYNSNLNCIVFTQLDFLPVDNPNVFIDVTYEVDNGF